MMAHPADKVPVGRGYGPFTFCQYPHVSSQTGSTGWSAYNGSSLYEYLDQAFPHRLEVDFLGCGKYYGPDTPCNLPTLQYPGRHPHVIQPSICTGPDHDLVNPHPWNIVNGMGVVRAVWK